MFTLNDDLSIYATRGDIVFFSVSADNDGVPYVFQPGDVVRIKVYGKKNAENVVLQKDFPVIEETENVAIFLAEEDTKIGGVISKATDYWYEVELNPMINPQTIIGFDEDGAKIFKLFPEGADLEEFVPDPEDIPVVDDALDLVSTRPVQNQAITRAVTKLTSDLERIWEKIYPVGAIYISVNNADPAALFGGTWERLKDRFLLGAGDTYRAGETGGESSHTLQLGEIPAHNHAIYDTGMENVNLGVEWGSYAGTERGYGFTLNGTMKTRDMGGMETGETNAHNNMPPYLAVYMWQRTA